MDRVAAPEAAYRHGYLQGVRSLLETIGTRIGEEQARALSKWADGPLTEWSRADDEAAAPMAPLIDRA